MKETLNNVDVKALFASIRDIMVENRDMLVTLDGAMGDGDLGVYMSDGFTSVCEQIKDNDSLPGRLIAQAGMALNNVAPSTLGTLMATALMRGGRVFTGEEIALSDAVVMLEAANNGMMERGKANRGDKTILDVTIPAQEALKAAFDAGKSFSEALDDAAAAAAEGVEVSKMWRSVRGRAGYYGDSSIGKIDAGAMAGSLLFKALADGFKNL